MKDEDESLWGAPSPPMPVVPPRPEIKAGDQFTIKDKDGEEHILVATNETKEQIITRIAKDIVANLIFTTESIRKGDENLLGMIFLPILLGGAKSRPQVETLAAGGMIYEYYAQAGPRSINGYPIFYSCYTMGVEDTKMVWEKVERIRRAIERASK
jgi:hypothetical protein